MTQPQVARPDVHFPPIPNGLDYLRSVVDHLSGEPTARDLKYGVLHLQAATEVLLKARLQRVHWSLVIKELGRADRGKFNKGEFESCGTREAVTRLRNIAGVSISDKDAKVIDDLAKTRNSLQHYGLTASAHAVEARAVEVLDILLAFIAEHLLPDLDGPEEEQTRDAMYELREPLNTMKVFIRTRMNRLRSELAGHEEQTVACPDCLQPTLVVGEFPLVCRFCDATWRDSAHALAVDYAEEVLHDDLFTSARDGAHPPVRWCSECGIEALVAEALTVASPDDPVRLCFNCGAGSADLVECEGGCGMLVQRAEDGGPEMCRNCLESAHDRI